MVSELPRMIGLASQLEREISIVTLKEFLFKLGIRSAEVTTSEKLKIMIRQVQNNSGTPDQIFMAPNMFASYQKAFVKKD